MAKKYFRTFVYWLPLGTAILITFAFVYVAVQQMYRQSLNDPQIQMVQDAQNKLASGMKPRDVVGSGPSFDISQSLAPFITVYDNNHTPIESSGNLGNTLPRPPAGVFNKAEEIGENRVTWQPNQYTRIALIIRPVGNRYGWFVASGRSMSEGEARIKYFTQLTIVGLLASLLISFFVYLYALHWRHDHHQEKVYEN
jgi:hypothetical protein